MCLSVLRDSGETTWILLYFGTPSVETSQSVVCLYVLMLVCLCVLRDSVRRDNRAFIVPQYIQFSDRSVNDMLLFVCLYVCVCLSV